MLSDFLKKVFNIPHKDEPEYLEEVEHDTVMEMVNGELVEVTGDDSEVRK